MFGKGRKSTQRVWEKRKGGALFSLRNIIFTKRSVCKIQKIKKQKTMKNPFPNLNKVSFLEFVCIKFKIKQFVIFRNFLWKKKLQKYNIYANTNFFEENFNLLSKLENSRIIFTGFHFYDVRDTLAFKFVVIFDVVIVTVYGLQKWKFMIWALGTFW